MKYLFNLLITICICGVLMTPTNYCSAAQQVIDVTVTGTQVLIQVNGNPVHFVDQEPYILQGRTMVPVRFISEALGAQVTWNDPEIDVTMGDKVIVIALNSKTAIVNGSVNNLDVPAFISGGRTMVPLRFIGETLGAEVKYHQITEALELTEQQKWAMATSDILKEANGLNLNKIGGYNKTEAMEPIMKESLAAWWGINNRSDALEVIQWLKNGGHRAEYEQLATIVAQVDEEQYKELLAATNYSSELQFVKSNSTKLASKSLIAWDYCRLVAVAEWSYIAGYLSKEEALAEMMSAAQILQSTYSSWEDLGNNYILGRIFWEGDESQERFNNALKSLLSEPDSPWVKYTWNFPLNN